MSNIILFRGKPGVGKTTLSNSVAQSLNIAIIRKDDVYDSLASAISEHFDRNTLCTQIMKKMILTQIKNETSVIIDNTLHYPNQIQDFQEWVRQKGGKLISILVMCSDEEIWKERFNKRKLSPQPNNLITDFDELKKHYKQLYTEPMTNELVLDSVKQIDELSKEACEWIRTTSAG